jgi:tetratricopeptide (TPR) repeat protein
MNRRRARVMVLRSLTAVRPGWFRLHLATALMDLSDLESFRGQSQAAEETAAEATSVSRRLADSVPGQHRMLLARALARHAASRHDIGAFDLALADISEATRLYNDAPAVSPQSATAGLADAHGTVALLQQACGRHGDALSAARDSVAAWRDLLPTNPRRYRPRLAYSLNLVAGCLSRLGQREEAIAAGGEAVDIYQRLPLLQRMRYPSQISHARIRLADELRTVGRSEEALVILVAALMWTEALAWRYPMTFGVYLAWLRHTEALAAADLGLHTRAADAARSAVTRYRALSGRDTTRYQAHLAAALRCWADTRAVGGHYADAVAALEEVIEIRTHLPAEHADIHQAELASDLTALADALWTLDRRTAATASNGRAVDVYRRIAAEGTSTEPLLVIALATWATRLDTTGETVEASDAAREAVVFARRLARDDLDAYLALLADCLNTLATALGAAGQEVDAVEAAQECVTIRRRLADNQPDSYRADLASGLNNLANRLLDVHRDSEAIVAYQEAIAIHRSAIDDAGHQASLALALANLAVPVANTGQLDDAIAHLDEAIAVRTLLADQTQQGRRNLAAALRRRATYLTDAGRHADTIPDLDAATGLYRALADIDPSTHQTDLALCLGFIAIQHARVNHHREAVDAIEQLRDLAQQNASPELHELHLDAVGTVHEVAPQPVNEAQLPSVGPASTAELTTAEDTATDTRTGPVTVDRAAARRVGRKAHAAAAAAERAFDLTIEVLTVRHRVGGAAAGRLDLAAGSLHECAVLLTTPHRIRDVAVTVAEMIGVFAALILAVRWQWGPVPTFAALIAGYGVGQLLGAATRAGLDRSDRRVMVSGGTDQTDQNEPASPPAGSIAALKAEIRQILTEIAAGRAALDVMLRALPDSPDWQQATTVQRRRARAARLAHDADALLAHSHTELTEYHDRL